MTVEEYNYYAALRNENYTYSKWEIFEENP